MKITFKIAFLLFLPFLVIGQVNRKYYNISSQLSQGIQVSADENGNGATILVFKLTSLKDFIVESGDTMTITFSDQTKTQITCDKPSSYHSQQTGSGVYYNALFFTIDNKQKEQFKAKSLKHISISRFVFDKIKKANSDAIAESIRWFYRKVD